MNNVVFWGQRRGSDGLVAEFHRIGDLIGLSIVWDDTLVAIMVQGHPNNPPLLASKVPIISIGCFPENHDWTTQGYNRGGLIVKRSLKVFPGIYIWG